MMEKLNKEALLLTSFVTRDHRKLFVSHEVTSNSSAVHIEYTNREDALANCHQGNGDSVTS